MQWCGGTCPDATHACAELHVCFRDFHVLRSISSIHIFLCAPFLLALPVRLLPPSLIEAGGHAAPEFSSCCIQSRKTGQDCQYCVMHTTKRHQKAERVQCELACMLSYVNDHGRVWNKHVLCFQIQPVADTNSQIYPKLKSSRVSGYTWLHDLLWHAAYMHTS